VLRNIETADTEKYRYERKFFIFKLTKYEIESLIRFHPAMFSAIYYPRFINNIYFDSINMKNYFDAVDGLWNRMKIRIRWYGDLFGDIEKPVLEIKIKNGLLNMKNSFQLKPFSISEFFDFDSIVDIIKISDIPENLKLEMISLKPTLLNRYKRKYVQSSDGDYRITVDTNMVYYDINSHNNLFLNKAVDYSNTVVELKYNYGKDDYAKHIVKYFPFRLTKSSKYVTGIEAINWC